MSFSQEDKWPGMNFSTWCRKQWCFHWSQGCIPCELLRNFKILNRFLNIVVVFKWTIWTKERRVVWLNAQIFLPNGPVVRTLAEPKWSGHSAPSLCSLSSQKPNSSALSDWTKLQVMRWYLFRAALGTLSISMFSYLRICSSVKSSSLEHWGKILCSFLKHVEHFE